MNPLQRTWRWLRADTLAKRLFLLMWAALVCSHVLAFAAVRWVHLPAHPLRPGDWPTLPSLPPTPGLDAGHRPAPPAAFEPPGPQKGLPEGHRPRPRHDGQGGGLPWDALALDYGIRLLVIALAAWWGSRWVSAPMQQLARAAETLGQELPSAQAPCTLDERRGTVEVRETAQVFNRMAQELQRQFQARSLLMAAISHDLRTPLTRLRMRLELLGLEPRVLERSVSDLRELNALVEQALALYQGHALQESAQTCDLDALLQSLCDDLAEQGQPIRYNSPAAPDEAARKPAIDRVQPQALRRVLNNLISNALRYGGSAELQLLPQEPGGWQIRIDDAGPGIPEAQLQAVFQAFYRLDSSRNRDTGGSGLGLYIAQELAAAMGAQLSLHNRPEGGLSARLSLPPP